MSGLFGTDGVRGLANCELTPELVLRLAAAAVSVLARDVKRPVVVVGRDTRASGEMLEAAVCAGLTSMGADVVRLGVVPTPAVAYLTTALSAQFGVVLSASHNPMPDNGIKFFAFGGAKLSDAEEAAIEAGVDFLSTARPTGADVGRITELPEAGEQYLAHLLATLPHRLDGLRIVVDCAHGAASALAPELYRRAGADVIAIGNQPDGWNINDGVGSTHLSGLSEAVVAHGADLGLAHDGDADRCLAVDASGQVIDGDQILAILALSMKEAGRLTENTLVATVMSNLGLHNAMRAAGISILTCPVGDRFVLAELTRHGLALGGEQSGHVVIPAYATTGDGLLTGAHVAARVAMTGSSLAELASVVRVLPQVLVNVPVVNKSVSQTPAVAEAVKQMTEELGDTGRVLLRSSGTEPLVRVMVEAPTLDQATTVAHQLAAVVASESGSTHA